MKPPIERFLSKISVSCINFYNNTPCWEWQNYRDKDGYGQFSIKSKLIITHRFIFEYYHGSICPDLTIDHLCQNRACVNPKHLEQVPIKENIRRGDTGKHFIGKFGVLNYQGRKTECPSGHPYDKENTMILNNNKRRCKICNRIQSLRSYHKQ